MPTERAENVKPFIVMDILARAGELEKAGESVIHFEVGEPDFDTPESVKEAAIEAIRAGKTHYTHAMGMPELRQAICDHYHKEYGVSVTPDRILVTSGTSPALFLTMMALVEKGEEVIISNPGYACYPNFVEGAGGKAIEVITRAEDGFVFTPDSIKEVISDRTRGILINSPSNPTGVVMSGSDLSRIASFENLYLISDEIYHGLSYCGRADTILQYTDRAFVVNGFSKLYAMTGWRLGYVIFPSEFSRAMERIHQSFMISANSFVQIAGISALKNTAVDIQNMRETYDKRRRFMIDGLKAIGLKIHREPTGAFYIFADIRHISIDSYAEAYNILEKARVGVTPGIDFGSGGEGFLRFSYATSMDNIKEGLNRLGKYFAER